MRQRFAYISIYILLLAVPSKAFVQDRLNNASAAHDSSQASATVLAATDAAGGLSAIKAMRNFKATGTIEYVNGNESPQGTVTFRGIGSETLRCDISLSGETRSWFVQGLSGSARRGDGKPSPLTMETVANLKLYVFPIGSLARARQLAVLAKTQPNDAPQTARLTLSPPPTKGSSGPQPPSVEFVIDGTANQIQSISSLVRGKRSKTDPVLQEILFSDYRAVSGVMFPFTIEERIGGQRVSIIHLQEVSPNVDLSLADLKF